MFFVQKFGRGRHMRCARRRWKLFVKDVERLVAAKDFMCIT